MIYRVYFGISVKIVQGLILRDIVERSSRIIKIATTFIMANFKLKINCSCLKKKGINFMIFFLLLLMRMALWIFYLALMMKKG